MAETYDEITAPETDTDSPDNQTLQDKIRGNCAYFKERLDEIATSRIQFSNNSDLIDLSVSGDNSYHTVSNTHSQIYIPTYCTSLKVRVSVEGGTGITTGKIRAYLCGISGGRADYSDAGNVTASESQSTLTISVSAANRGQINDFHFEGKHDTGSAKSYTIHYWYARVAAVT